MARRRVGLDAIAATNGVDLPRVLLEVLRVVEEDGREDVRHPQSIFDAQLRAEEDHGQDARQEDGDGRRVALEHRVGVLEHGGDGEAARGAVDGRDASLVVEAVPQTLRRDRRPVRDQGPRASNN